MTAFGFNDAGGGTTVPRIVAYELVRRGWDVTVFYAAARPGRAGAPYAVRESEDDGVRLVGVLNRQHGLLDLGHPYREIDDPPITAAFGACSTASGPTSCTSTTCTTSAPRCSTRPARAASVLLLHAQLLARLPARLPAHRRRRDLRRPRRRGATAPPASARRRPRRPRAPPGEHPRPLHARRHRVLAVSDACAARSSTRLPGRAIDVVRQAVPAADEIWERARPRPARRAAAASALTVGFFGSAYPHKGAHLLVEAAQLTEPRAPRPHPRRDRRALRRASCAPLDRRGVVEIRGAFAPDALPELLAGVDVAAMPSLWWDCAPLVAGECLAARVPVLAPRMGGLAEAVRRRGRRPALRRPRRRRPRAPARAPRRRAGPARAPAGRHRGARAFAAYVDELEAYYAGERPSRAPAGDRRARPPLARRPRPAHEPLAHQPRGRRRA